MSGTCKAAQFSPAAALWNQRNLIADLRGPFRDFWVAVDAPASLSLYQWTQIASVVLEFRPDCIIELGRHVGNSTCCFIEVANRLGGRSACRLVSLCRQREWSTRTVPRLERMVTKDWFAPADIRVCNITDCDPGALVEGASRCLIFWDAHGFDVAEWVLGKLLPKLTNIPHLVLVHDLSDTRFETGSRDYDEAGLWKGTNAEQPSFWLGTVFSRVAQAISIVDFCTRNGLPLHSAAESLNHEIASDPAKQRELSELLGDDFFSLQAHWFWFTLNEAPHRISFPPATGQKLEPELERLKKENAELQSIVTALENSAGWRMLDGFRKLRDSVAPRGTLQRRLYDSMLRMVRS